MKVIFLDIDGVLNNDHDDIVHNTEGFYCPVLVDRLNKIIHATRAKIVVSSTWRLSRRVSQLQDTLSTMGVIGEVIGRTDDIEGRWALRGNAIFKYILDNTEQLGVERWWDFKSYVILDDDNDMLLDQVGHFVRTDGLLGLTEKNVQQAIEILNRK
jgi:hypothetical protein